MSYYDATILEGQLKNEVAEEWFGEFDCKKLLGAIDFAVAAPPEHSLFSQGGNKRTDFLLWAEVKQGIHQDINESFVQLILTIGKAHTFEQYAPPPFLGAFDAEKIAFINYSDIADIFYKSDFNWMVTPSNHKSKEFEQLYALVESCLNKKRVYYYGEDRKTLKSFITTHFKVGKKAMSPIRITSRNFIYVYQKWVHEVKPTIDIPWEDVKKYGLLDFDFYLADLMSKENETIIKNLFVLLSKSQYVYDVKENMGGDSLTIKRFTDEQKAHTAFWSNYKRPPEKLFQDTIITRRDLFVPNDMRVRKGAFYTPHQWVKLSQHYLERELGEGWQEKYYIWDCCAGTGNLLEGLSNRNNIYASTLYEQDVLIMHQRIDEHNLNMWKEQAFQFDFLNDKFYDEKVPKRLRKILKDPEERKKLVIYINPPYAEATSAMTLSNTQDHKHKGGVAKNNDTYNKYYKEMGKASNELFAQFLIRMYRKLGGCIIANFSTLKVLQGQNFSKFRNLFKARLGSLFIVPAKTFDNVQGNFPIGFHIWHTAEEEDFDHIEARVYTYDKDIKFVGIKNFYNPKNNARINEWIKAKDNKNASYIVGFLSNPAPDFQQNRLTYISNKIGRGHFNFYAISGSNIIAGCVYLAVRQCIADTWLNDRDQFYAPKESWQYDTEFQSNCLVYTLFHSQNKITTKQGTNHWIPFTEYELGLTNRLESHFMSDFIAGKSSSEGLFGREENKSLTFSPEAQAVMRAGLELWKYYLEQPKANINASLYDIREHFKGRNDKGKVNAKSNDAIYIKHINHLTTCMKVLAKKIEPKVYEHGFLMGE